MKYIVNTVAKYATFLVVLSLVGCESCQEKPADPPPKPPAPEVSVKEDEPVDPLKEAREDAEPKAEAVAVALGDSARAAAAEIEAMAKRPKPKIIRPKITGAIEPKEAKKVFNRHLGAMKKCYERELKKNPGLQGKVKLSVVINTDGKVSRASASGVTLKNSRVNGCMEREARAMKFPKPTGGSVRVNNPYTFTPEN